MANTHGHQAHLDALCKKHALLSEKVKEAQQHPSTTASELRRLKAQKLELKDKIEREKQHAH